MNKTLVGLLALLMSTPDFAAVTLNLHHEHPLILLKQAYPLALRELSRQSDFNKTLHIRLVQTYMDYPVWGAHAVVHIPDGKDSKEKWDRLINDKTFTCGQMYQNIKQDLNYSPSFIFSEETAHKVLLKLQQLFPGKTMSDQLSQLIVYVDKQHQAHWAYKISFFVQGSQTDLPQRPVYIVDAINASLYLHWDEVKSLQTVQAGGFIGNHKTGQKLLDGLNGHLSPLLVSRDENLKICYMTNDNVSLRDVRTGKLMQFACDERDPAHNHIYWNANHDQVATTWSPANDVMFGIETTGQLFKQWYGLPVWARDGKSQLIRANVHDAMENAVWTGTYAIFGNSLNSTIFNPFTQLDTVAHELAHAFTQQHAGLIYAGESGGLNESFSDCVAIAAEYYAFGETRFNIGWGDLIAEGKALRYMDQPSRDCAQKGSAKFCSIDHVDQYRDDLEPHHSSGVFNRFYYNLANTPDWNPHKALNLLVHANLYYWTAMSSFADAACDVMHAARDYKYDEEAVAKAFRLVGLSTSHCQTG